MYKYYSYFIILLLLQLSFGCSNNKAVKAVQESEQLYYVIGGQESIINLVDILIKKIAQDPEILPYFAKSSVKHFKQGFIKHFCAIVDGPCHYDGDSMVDIHTGMNINERDFNRVVELLVESMEEIGISYRDQNKILVKLVPLRKEIIKI